MSTTSQQYQHLSVGQEEDIQQGQHECYNRQYTALSGCGFINQDLNEYWLEKHHGDISKTLTSLQDVMQYYM
ncbi:cysS [Acrasis kona]|uniref:CysS n=1 Tax=Acrasis kona TaxID=1008807 RepID=A0AAW2ZCY8_9EUKA